LERSGGGSGCLANRPRKKEKKRKKKSKARGTEGKKGGEHQGGERTFHYRYWCLGGTAKREMVIAAKGFQSRMTPRQKKRPRVAGKREAQSQFFVEKPVSPNRVGGCTGKKKAREDWQYTNPKKGGVGGEVGGGGENIRTRRKKGGKALQWRENWGIFGRRSPSLKT